MRFHYYPETDSLYIELSEQVSKESQEVGSGVVLDFALMGLWLGSISTMRARSPICLIWW